MRGYAADIERMYSLLGEVQSKGPANYSSSTFSETIPSKSFQLLKKSGLEGGALKKFVVSRLVLLLAMSILSYLFFPGFSFVLIPFFLFVAFSSIKRRVRKRAMLFEKDYVAFLLAYGSSIRTGLDPISAFSGCAPLFPKDSLIYSELNSFKLSIESGDSEDQAICKFASTIDHEDIGLLKTAVLLARKHGASLSECLLRLGKITRQRQSFRRKTKAALAMQRLSAMGISLCAVLVGIIQFVANPEAASRAFVDPTGKVLMSCGIGLMLLGLLWMLWISRERV